MTTGTFIVLYHSLLSLCYIFSPDNLPCFVVFSDTYFFITCFIVPKNGKLLPLGVIVRFTGLMKLEHLKQ